MKQEANTFLLGNYRVAIRPYAIDLLKQLRDHGFPVYVLSSASEDYCVGICNYFNRISPGLILNSASCRIQTMKGVIVMQVKTSYNFLYLSYFRNTLKWS